MEEVSESANMYENGIKKGNMQNKWITTVSFRTNGFRVTRSRARGVIVNTLIRPRPKGFNFIGMYLWVKTFLICQYIYYVNTYIFIESLIQVCLLLVCMYV